MCGPQVSAHLAPRPFRPGLVAECSRRRGVNENPWQERESRALDLRRAAAAHVRARTAAATDTSLKFRRARFRAIFDLAAAAVPSTAASAAAAAAVWVGGLRGGRRMNVAGSAVAAAAAARTERANLMLRRLRGARVVSRCQSIVGVRLVAIVVRALSAAGYRSTDHARSHNRGVTVTAFTSPDLIRFCCAGRDVFSRHR